MEFIQKLVIADISDRYIYVIATCEDSSGNTMPVFEKALQKVHSCITARRTESILMKDKFPKLKTGFIGFFFRTFGKSSRPFYVTEACTGCGLCKRICLKNTIVMQEKQPLWGKNCDQCYACINRCPYKAIQYGKKTEKRGRYHHPVFKNSTK